MVDGFDTIVSVLQVILGCLSLGAAAYIVRISPSFDHVFPEVSYVLSEAFTFSRCDRRTTSFTPYSSGRQGRRDRSLAAINQSGYRGHPLAPDSSRVNRR